MARRHKIRYYDVRLTNHGYDQYIARMQKMGAKPMKRKDLENRIQGRFNEKIGSGLTMDHTMAVKVPVELGFDAIVKPDFRGFWIVATFKYWHELSVVGLGA